MLQAPRYYASRNETHQADAKKPLQLSFCTPLSIAHRQTPLQAKLAADAYCHTQLPTPSAGSPECCCQPMLQWQHRPRQRHPQLEQPQPLQCRRARGTPRLLHRPQRAGPACSAGQGCPYRQGVKAQHSKRCGNAVCSRINPTPSTGAQQVQQRNTRHYDRCVLLRLLGNIAAVLADRRKRAPTAESGIRLSQTHVLRATV